MANKNVQRRELGGTWTPGMCSSSRPQAGSASVGARYPLTVLLASCVVLCAATTTVAQPVRALTPEFERLFQGRTARTDKERSSWCFDQMGTALMEVLMARSWESAGKQRDPMDPINSVRELAASRKITPQDAADQIAVIRAVQVSKRLDDDVSGDISDACQRNVRIVP